MLEGFQKSDDPSEDGVSAVGKRDSFFSLSHPIECFGESDLLLGTTIGIEDIKVYVDIDIG